MATTVEFGFEPKPGLRINEEAVTQYLLRVLGERIVADGFLSDCGITMRQMTDQQTDTEVLADAMVDVGNQMRKYVGMSN